MFGVAYFPGVQQIVDATFAFNAHGISPSVCTLTIAPQASFVGVVGTLQWAFLGESGSVIAGQEFPDCKIDTGSFEWNDQGQVWRLQIHDRRWMWRYGTISGRYNQREPDGSTIKTGTEKTLRELATLLLKAMGETGYDVSALPAEPRPEVDWDAVVPAEALASLCEEFACRPVLRLDNKVYVCKVGVGASLPTADIMADSLACTIPDAPDKIGVMCGRSRWQLDLELEAVGEESDGNLKPIDSLSYKPAAGWGTVDLPHFGQVAKEYRELAKKTVFRWYRIKMPSGGIVVPSLPGSNPIKDIELLAIEAEQLSTHTDLYDVRHVNPAIVYGVWWPALSTLANNVASVDPANMVIYQHGFSIDTSRPKQGAVVVFGDPVFRNTETATPPNKMTKAGAALFLRTTVIVRDATTRGWLRHSKTRKTGQTNGTGTRYVHHDEIELKTIVNYVSGSSALTIQASQGSGATVNNTLTWEGAKGIDYHLDYYLDAIEQEYQNYAPQTIIYPGLKIIQPDGAIQQITFNRGATGLTTTITRCTEQVHATLSYQERRRIEQTKRYAEQQTALAAWKTGMERQLKGQRLA